MNRLIRKTDQKSNITAGGGRRYGMAGLFTLLAFIFMPQSLAAEQISFDEGLRILLKENGKVMQAGATVLSFQALQAGAENATTPRLNMTAFVAPIFRNRGDIYSYERDYSDWGPLVHTDAEIIWPVFQFGRVSDARRAADYAVKAGKAQKKSDINSVIFEYKKIYLGQILIKRLRPVLKEASEKIDDALAKAQEAYATGEGIIKRKDLARLKIYALEVDKLKEELEFNQKQATLALGHYLGRKKKITVSDADFPVVDHDFFTLEKVMQAALEKNPDLKAVNLGLRARESQVELEKGSILPVLFLGGRISADYTEMSTDQHNPYVMDPYNRIEGGVAFGARWELDWGSRKTKVMQAESELKKLQGQQREAETGIPLKVSNAFHRMQKEYRFWRVSRRKVKEASKWLVSEWSTYSAGVGNPEDLLEAMGAYYMARKEMAEAEYRYCLAWAEVSYEVGEQAMLERWQVRE